MPQLFRISCDSCKTTFFSMVPLVSDLYVISDDGVRVHCKHPSEDWYITQVYPDIDIIDQSSLREKGLVGQDFLTICLDCLNVSRHDRNKGEFTCSNCARRNTVTAKELVGKTCPNCHKGIIISEPNGWS